MNSEYLSHLPVPIYPTDISSLCQHYHIHRLALFGSVLRQEFSPTSDIDVLVEFDDGHTPDFFRLYELEQALSTLFGGHAIDLVTYQALNPLLSPHILAQAQVIYEQQR